MSEPSRVQIKVHTDGTGSVVVDGRDLSYMVRGLVLNAGVGNLATLRLDLCAAEVEVDGMAELMFSEGGTEPPESWSDPERLAVPYLGWRWLFRRTKRGRK